MQLSSLKEASAQLSNQIIVHIAIEVIHQVLHVIQCFRLALVHI